MSITSAATAIPAVRLLTFARHGDARGFFAETYSRRDFAAVGINCEFVQDNHSKSVHVGTVRGLHFQTPPFAQAKLVSVLRGAILDVAVDLRYGSPTLGQHVAAPLSSDEASALFVPEGFAHGFATLEPDTEVLYKVTGYYAPEHDRGLLWNDSALGINWPIDAASATLSERDRTHPPLAELTPCFSYVDAGQPA